jgi:(S)-2-hydroxy-acid oxidase
LDISIINSYAGLALGINYRSVIYFCYRDITKNLVLRAEKAGFKAIALTVDTPLFGLRWADVRNKFTLPQHLRYKV